MAITAIRVSSVFLAFAVIFRRHCNAKDYDAIIVGSGAGGCPLAQTLIEQGKDVLLLERGGRPNKNSRNKANDFNAKVNNDCIERFNGDGVVVSTGRCFGGATTYGQGVWVEEPPDQILNSLAWLTENPNEDNDNSYRNDDVMDAYHWVRKRVAPRTATNSNPDIPQEVYKEELIQAMHRTLNVPIVDNGGGGGTPILQESGGIWRTHSIFQPDTNVRLSADTLLDETNPHLDLKLNSEVSKIEFDDDVATRKTARCVKLTNGQRYCIRNGGRIYLAAGAIHTPRLLITSGIGPNGHVQNNPQVGKDLRDKPFFPMSAYFSKGFTFGETFGSILEVIATKPIQLSSSSSRLMVAEELTAGKKGDLLDLALYERLLIPRYLRFSILADITEVFLNFCQNAVLKENGGGFLTSWLCPLKPFYDEGCTANIASLACFVSEPTSTGQLTVKSDGKLKIDPGYLSTRDDIEVLGATVRAMSPVWSSRTGPSAVADPNDFCPSFYGLLQNFFALSTLNLGYFGFPTSEYDPTWVKPSLETLNDIEMGEKAKPYILSSGQLAGTAAMGTVVDGNFKVLGVEGLYVVDASVVPRITSVNMMATTMMLGRLAGLSFVNDTDE